MFVVKRREREREIEVKIDNSSIQKHFQLFFAFVRKALRKLSFLQK